MPVQTTHRFETRKQAALVQLESDADKILRRKCLGNAIHLLKLETNVPIQMQNRCPAPWARTAATDAFF